MTILFILCMDRVKTATQLMKAKLYYVPLINPNHGSVDGAGMNHILQTVNEERNDGKDRPKYKAQQSSCNKCRITIHIADTCCDLVTASWAGDLDW